MKIVIGLDIGATNLKAVLVNSQGKILIFSKIKTEAESGGKKVVQNIKNLIILLLNQAKTKKISVRAIGVGSPGPINFVKGEIISPPNLPGWHDLPLKKILKKEFNLPIFLDNDANCALLAEKWLGAAKKFNSVLLLTLGSGIGGAFIKKNHLYRGKNGQGAEFGHLKIHPKGKKCNCGSRGCLEAYASATALRKMALETDLKITEVKDIFILARQNNPKAKEILREMIADLALALKILTKTFQPEAIILGGGMMESADLILPQLEAEMKKNRGNSKITILKAELGEKSGVIGAAKLAL